MDYLSVRRRKVSSCIGSIVYSSIGDSSSNEGSRDSSSIDSMRKMLENSWNSQTMGLVPSTPDLAAKAAAQSLVSAINNNDDNSNNNVYFIDLQLPSYDITLGSNTYDEISAIEFCLSLSNYINKNPKQQQNDSNNSSPTPKITKRSLILLKDNKQVNTINKLLQAKERKSQIVDDDDEDNDELLPEEDEEKEDVDDFRKRLMTNWENTMTDDNQKDGASTTRNQDESLSTTSSINNSNKCYRISSMIGSYSNSDTGASSGGDMIQNVINQVKKYALPRDNEDVIIILSAMSNEEMIATRALVQKYTPDTKKCIVFVNCKFDTYPTEIQNGIIVYSILPLVIQKKSNSDNEVFNNSSNNQKQQQQGESYDNIKIVLMRRYPNDYELYIDDNNISDGKGFQLIDTISPNLFNSKGPTMEFISTRVKQYMQDKFMKS